MSVGFYWGMCATTEGDAFIPGSVQVQCFLCPHMVWVSPGGREIAKAMPVACHCCVEKLAERMGSAAA